MNISDNQREQQIIPILRLGFRPFFLFGSLFAVIAMLLWLLTLQGVLTLAPLNGSAWWHSHEMLFGFSSAIIAGFLLTAVQTWTNMPSIKGGQLFALFTLWLAARLLILYGPNDYVSVIMLIDIAFLPLTALLLGARIVKIRQFRNVIFIPVLLLMAFTNLLTYLPAFGLDPRWANKGLHGMTMLVTFLVAFLGGRVIPMFTANGTKTEKVLPVKWLEWLCLFSLFMVFLVMITGVDEYPRVIAGICFASALLHLSRQIRWRPWVTLGVPLVWSLHFTLLFIPTGLVLIGMHFLTGFASLSTALHSLTVGVIGGMILAMTSRVSLGHTGRILKVGVLMRIAFVAIIISAFTRSVLVAVWPQFSVQLWAVSGVLWCFAFGSFVWAYSPILSTPRVDGRPG